MKKLLLVFATIITALALVYLPELFHNGRTILNSGANKSGISKNLEKKVDLAEHPSISKNDSIILEGLIKFGDKNYENKILEIKKRNTIDSSGWGYQRASVILHILENFPDSSKVSHLQKLKQIEFYFRELKSDSILNSSQVSQMRKIIGVRD